MAHEGLDAFLHPEINFKNQSINADIGGEENMEITNYFKTKGATNIIYNPGKMSSAQLRLVLHKIIKKSDTATSFGVLNILLDKNDRDKHLRLVSNCLKSNNCFAYFKIYEGDCSGVPTLLSSKYIYPQMNAFKEVYFDEIKQYFDIIDIQEDLITCIKN